MVEKDPIIRLHFEIVHTIRSIKNDRLLILFNNYHRLRTAELAHLIKKVDRFVSNEKKSDHNFLEIQKIKNEVHDKTIEIRNEFERELNARSLSFEKKLNAFEKLLLARPRLSGLILLIRGRGVFMPKVDSK